MGVNAGTLGLIPAQNHQVESAITLVYKVPCVPGRKQHQKCKQSKIYMYKMKYVNK